MVAGDRATGTVRSEQTASGTNYERRIAKLEAENERLVAELARREQERQEIIDHYERVLQSGERAAGEDRTNEDGVLARVRGLFK